ncbi:MAG: hypothetical protein PHG08_01080 [Bacilli bacterium]|nr:hypothetical protein [Bacilli bacterium]
MKKLFALLLLLISFSANAYKESYGTFGNWDSYYLSFNNGEQLCAARGFFENDYKVIFNFLVEPDNTKYLKINIENPNWTVSPGQAFIDIAVLNSNGRSIYSGKGILNNDTSFNVSQASIMLVGGNILPSLLNGYTLVIYTENRVLSFDISSTNVNNSVNQLGQCIFDKFSNNRSIIQPENTIRPSVKELF